MISSGLNDIICSSHSHRIHSKYRTVVCWKTVRDKLSLKTIAYILSKLAGKGKPGMCLLALLK